MTDTPPHTHTRPACLPWPCRRKPASAKLLYYVATLAAQPIIALCRSYEPGATAVIRAVEADYSTFYLQACSMHCIASPVSAACPKKCGAVCWLGDMDAVCWPLLQVVDATAACSASPSADAAIEVIVQDVEASSVTIVRGPRAAASSRRACIARPTAALLLFIAS